MLGGVLRFGDNDVVGEVVGVGVGEGLYTV